MRRASNRNRKNDTPHNFWQSYSDMMAALLLFFILALVGSALSARINLDQRESELESQKDELEALQDALEEQIAHISDLENENEEQGQELSELEKMKAAYEKLLRDYADVKKKSKEKDKKISELTAANASQDTMLTDAENDLAAANAQLAAMMTDMSDLQDLYDQQSVDLADATARLVQIESEEKIRLEQMDDIVGVRKKMIDKLTEAFSDENVAVDPQTGAVTFSSAMLFDKNDDELKKPGKEFLENFFPKYVDLILSDDFIDSVEEIIIEGHTDTDGSYLYNLQLSQDRALAVASYLLGEKGEGSAKFSPEIKEKLGKIVTANGRSFSNPIYDKDGSVDKEASRRVEIRFRLNDEEMVKKLIEVFG